MTVTLAHPYYPPETIPLLTQLTLSDDERSLLKVLQDTGDRYRFEMELCNAYYHGRQVIKNLKIAVPKELEHLRTLVGWGRTPVDPLAERMRLDGFRLPGQTDADSELMDVWCQNNMDAELSLCLTDSLVMGRGYILVGSPTEAGGPPLVTVESPLNVIVLWDAKTRQPRAALQSYWQGDRRYAALCVPDQTITIAQGDNEEWEVVDRDEHHFGRVPIAMLANQPRSYARDGFSEITPEVMAIVDAGCRTLLGLEVAREFYSVPQKLILGASESDFQKPDGTPKSAWDTYITRILALERDAEGNLPQIHQFTPYDPSVFTKLIDMYASQMAGITGVPPQYLGLYTQGNPVSAEAAQVNESRLDRKAWLRMRSHNGALRDVAQLILRFMNGGTLPDNARGLEVDWSDPALVSMAQSADAMSKWIAAGSVPATSDVVLKRGGFNAQERQRLDQDRQADQDDQLLNQLARPPQPPAFQEPGSDSTSAPSAG